LHSHLDFLPSYLDNVRDEHGKMFHQELSDTEKCCQGRWHPNILADSCETLLRETPDISYKQEYFVFNLNILFIRT